MENPQVKNFPGRGLFLENSFPTDTVECETALRRLMEYLGTCLSHQCIGILEILIYLFFSFQEAEYWWAVIVGFGFFLNYMSSNNHKCTKSLFAYYCADIATANATDFCDFHMVILIFHLIFCDNHKEKLLEGILFYSFSTAPDEMQ